MIMKKRVYCKGFTVVKRFFICLFFIVGMTNFLSAEEQDIILPGFQYKIFSKEQSLRDNRWDLIGTDFEVTLKFDKIPVFSGVGIYSFSDVGIGALENVDVNSLNLTCWNFAIPLKFGEVIIMPVFLGGNINADLMINNLFNGELTTERFFNYGLFSSYKNTNLLFFKGDFLPDVNFVMKLTQKNDIDLFGLLCFGNYKTEGWTINPGLGYLNLDGNVDLNFSSKALVRIFDYFYFDTDLKLDVVFAGGKLGFSVNNFDFSGLIGAANIPFVRGDGKWKYKYPKSMKLFVNDLSSTFDFNYDLLKTLGVIYIGLSANWKIPSMENFNLYIKKNFLLPFGFEEPCAGIIRDYYEGFTKQDYIALFLKGIAVGISFKI